GVLVDRVDEVKGRAGDKLREHLSDVLRNRQLTELARDVPLEIQPADLRPAPWDREQIHQLFDTLQFRVLRDRLYSTLPNGIIGQLTPTAPASGGAAFDVDLARLGPGEVAGWLASHAATGRVGLAVSGTWGRATGDVDGLALARPAAGGDGDADEEAPASPAAFIDPVAISPQDEHALAEWLSDESSPKALHDAKGPMHALAARGLRLRGL